MSSYRWIPWAIAGALGVVVAVNGALAYFAVTSSTGLVSEHPFTDGNTYNRVLDAAAAQDALGWRGLLRFARAKSWPSFAIATASRSAASPSAQGWCARSSRCRT